jgi:hypothetical protein
MRWLLQWSLLLQLSGAAAALQQLSRQQQPQQQPQQLKRRTNAQITTTFYHADMTIKHLKSQLN